MGILLTRKERNELLEAHRHESWLRFGDRIKTILLLDSDWPVAKISEALLLDPDTVRKYRALYESGGIDELCSFSYTGKQCSLSDEALKELVTELRSKIYSCTAEVVDYIRKAFGIVYSVSGARYLLHRIGFSYKKPCLVPGKANAASQIEFLRMLSRLKARKCAKDKLYYGDGTHPQHNSLPAYGWLPKGEEVALKSNTGRQRINLSGVLDAETHELIVREHPRLNAEATIDFFKVLERLNPESKNIYVILDNAGYYKGEKIREYLKRSRIKIVFLPPYAPNLNLIERLWKFFKKRVLYNQYYETFQEFRRACLEFFTKKSFKRYRRELTSLLTERFQVVSA